MKRLLLSAFLVVGCGAADPECFVSEDCSPRSICLAGQCQQQPLQIQDAPQTSAGPIVVAPADASAPEDEPSAPASCREARLGEVFIEEILSDVPAGDQGDANRDGVRDPYDDEFVEVSNATDESIGLRGIEIHVNGTAKYRFDQEDCLAPRSVIVVFSGGPSGSDRRVAGKRFGLANSGGQVTLVQANVTLDSIEYAGDAEGSWVRVVPHHGEFVPHRAFASPFSPGRCPDGSVWDGVCAVAIGEPDAG